jgi:hypothetical protein
MPSPRIIVETQSGTDADICPSLSRTGTRMRSLNIVRLKEVVADVAAETEAMARVEKEDGNATVKKPYPFHSFHPANHLPMALICESSLRKDFTNKDTREGG